MISDSIPYYVCLAIYGSIIIVTVLLIITIAVGNVYSKMIYVKPKPKLRIVNPFCECNYNKKKTVKCICWNKF